MRFASAALFATALLAACGGSDKKETPPVDLTTAFPANGEVTGWNRSGAPEVGVGATGATALVDGAADPFIAVGLAQIVQGSYANAGAGQTLSPIRVWQMTSTANAQTVYTSLLSNSLYSANTWVACATAVGEACRVADTGNHWWINTRKGAFHVELTIGPKTTATQDAALTFAAALLAKLP